MDSTPMGSFSQDVSEFSRPKSPKIFNDPIHGHVELPPACVRIVDTPQFQRLRYIRQVGGSYLVFPGASHNRFEHSIGVCHLAGQMVKTIAIEQPELQITQTDILCVQIAGMCHDLGHGPFSHLFDVLFMPAAVPDEKWQHEDASVAMFDYLIDANKIDLSHYNIDSIDRLFIKELIVGPLEEDGEYKGRSHEKLFLYQIVANKKTGIDVDKWDYFARDCHHLGINSLFDHARLMKFCRVIKDENGIPNICFRDKEISNIYDMFHTRQVLHRRAYQHKTALGIEKMISDAFLAADKHLHIPGTNGIPRCISECKDDMAAYTRLTDNIYHMILCSTDPKLDKARHILERVECRKIYKCVGQTKPKKDQLIQKSDISSIEKELADIHATKTERKCDLFVSIINFDYGMKEQDPVVYVRFYSKNKPNKSKRISRHQVSHMLPETFCDQILNVYCRSQEHQDIVLSRQTFKDWCKSKDGIEDSQDEEEED